MLLHWQLFVLYVCSYSIITSITKLVYCLWLPTKNILLSKGEKPIATEICFTKPCYEDYEYRALGMTDCSRSCLGGKL